jgi:hypothetical protein
MKEIVFIDMVGVLPDYAPIPAKSSIPDWYKELNSYTDNKKIPNGNGGTSATIKKCIPVFDAITAGYFIKLPADVFVTQKEDGPYYEWSNYGLIQFHPVSQAPNHPHRNKLPIYPKFINPWSIKTPKGYSCLFTAPKHRDNSFTILDGIVDTDTYFAPVNFPFVLNDNKFEGLIPAGTIIAQVIPFKRDAYTMVINKSEDNQNAQNILQQLKTKMFDSYKTQFWHKKEYK